MPINSYPQVYALGHKLILDIFSSEVQIEEKIDGSHLSWGISLDGDLLIRSHKAELYIESHDGMFKKAIQSIVAMKQFLVPGWIYRGEYLQKPTHNVLEYSRVPDKNIIGFDIDDGLENYHTYEYKSECFNQLGMECVPLMYRGVINSVDQIRNFLDTISILGNSKIEGVVVKNYSLFNLDKKVKMGKFVSEKFKEVSGEKWRKDNPTSADILEQIVSKYKTDARWSKAVQHLSEEGTLEQSPRDIGNLIKEVGNDIEKECIDEIKDILWKYFWPKVKRGVTSRLPEWWKSELLKKSLENKNDSRE